MEIKNTLKCQWKMINRSKIYYIYIFVIYFGLAFFDLSGKCVMISMDDYISRFTFQQLFIVFSCMFVVRILLNESFLELFDNFILLYIKDAKRYFYATLLLLNLVNIVPFIIGQLLVLIFNYLYSGTIPIMLFLVNIFIVSIEIIIAISLLMTLSLILRKNLLVYLIYFMVTFSLLILNNVYVSIPLSMNILGTQEYYITFSPPLWLGRIILLVISGLLFNVTVNKFIKYKY